MKPGIFMPELQRSKSYLSKTNLIPVGKWSASETSKHHEEKEEVWVSVGTGLLII